MESARAGSAGSLKATLPRGVLVLWMPLKPVGSSGILVVQGLGLSVFKSFRIYP